MGATLDGYLYTRDGLNKFAAKNYRPAYQDFMSALEDDPLNPNTHLNIARALEANEEFEKAEKGYRGVLNILPKESPLRFQALFNLAGVLGKEKKIPEALEVYQRALEIDPDNIEVKNNIELLIQQGGGEGEGDSQSQKQDDKGKGGQDEQKNPQQKEPEQKKQQPKPFNSQELTPQDVKKILDEIKNQEQSIRAQENDKGAKEAPREKDW